MAAARAVRERIITVKRYLLTYQIPFKAGGGQVLGHAFVSLERLTQSALEEAAETFVKGIVKDHPDAPALGGLQWQSVVPLEG